MTRPLVLGLDLDSVVADYETAFRAHVSAARGVDPATIPSPAEWGFGEPWGFSDPADYLAEHSAAVAAGMFVTMPVMPGAAEALKRLSKDGVHIRVITHRILLAGQHRQAVSDTVAWLDMHRIPYWDMCFVGDKSRVDADVYVDDAPHNVEALRACGHNVIVFDALYNRHLDGPRAANWVEAEALIRQFLPA